MQFERKESATGLFVVHSLMVHRNFLSCLMDPMANGYSKVQATQLA